MEVYIPPYLSFVHHPLTSLLLRSDSVKICMIAQAKQDGGNHGERERRDANPLGNPAGWTSPVHAWCRDKPVCCVKAKVLENTVSQCAPALLPYTLFPLGSFFFFAFSPIPSPSHWAGMLCGPPSSSLLGARTRPPLPPSLPLPPLLRCIRLATQPHRSTPVWSS